MKNLVRVVALFAALLLSSLSQASAIYNYQYAVNGILVTGSFEGTASGNLITGLSHVSANANGVALIGSGNLFSSSYSNQGWSSGSGVASFNGSENNFLFIDTDYPNDYNFTNYVYDIRAVLGSSAAWVSVSQYYSGGAAVNWSITQANAVPEPTSIFLLGVAMVGFAAARRRNNA